ncbi:alpha/beta fold hydrolase [Natrialba sp. INN-245]|uniref:alpha/beta hydrolase family protein n=1 Tax=Natrialba sp. INN-245 TaxID=2690967 RepID=UPI0013134E1F|nr:alpha/beta fold hydrolase [Natrialba sp. INN-245]MWV40286.1 alpha/beta fold hydrolase [Natrialba sp. INN-245]
MVEHHEVPVAGGESVAAVHHEAPSNRWFVCCHGFLSDKSGSYERRCRRAVQEGYNGVRFDFRGCGESDGAFVEQGVSEKIADLEAVVDDVEPSSIVLFGSSFGGKVAFHAATGLDRVEAVVTRAPVTDNRAFDNYRSSVAADGEHRFETGDRIDDRFFEDLDRYPFDDVVSALDVPVAIFHGTADESVDVDDSIDATRRLETDVLLQTFSAEGHRFSAPAESRLLALTFDWLESIRS